MAVPVTITDLTTTVASNSPQGSDAIGTNADDYIRALSAILKESGATLYTATGTDTITFSTTPTFSAYASGQRFFVKAAAANTGAVTVNINTLGAKNVLKSGATALAAGDIPAANAHFLIEYDGTQFQLLNPPTTSVSAGFAVGGATAGTGGIAFPATAVAVADVNTLDDYEEGTFTPGISFGAGTTGITYNAQLGSYTKIGNRVICSMYVELTAKGSSTGQVRVTGLPFTIGNSSNNYGGAGLRINQISSTGIIQGYPELNTTSLLFEQVSTAGTMTTLTDANFGATSSLMISVQYHV